MTDAQTSSPRRAVVLGGGGVAGIAWHLGMLKELQAGGIALGDADLVVGTSAGSVAGSVLRFGLVDAVYDSQLGAGAGPAEAGSGPAGAAAGGGDSIPAEPDLTGGLGDSADMATFGDRIGTAIAGASSPDDARARLGQAAVAYSEGSGESFLLTTFAQQFPAAFGWPAGRLGVCVVDATTGAFRVLDADSGVDLSRAVAASCSVPLVFPPVEIDGAPFIDGGARSGTNADVASGYDRVLVLACGPEAAGSPMGPQIDEAAAGLRANGSDVLVLTADEASIRAFGSNSLASASRIPSAEAGRAQARGLVDQVRTFWA